jgi:hypothetical protein
MSSNMSNICKRHNSQSAGRKDHVCMKRCSKVTSKHCRANLDFGRIPVKRQILSVHVYDKLPQRMFYVKRVRYNPKQ